MYEKKRDFFSLFFRKNEGLVLMKTSPSFELKFNSVGIIKPTGLIKLISSWIQGKDTS